MLGMGGSTWLRLGVCIGRWLFVRKYRDGDYIRSLRSLRRLLYRLLSIDRVGSAFCLVSHAYLYKSGYVGPSPVERMEGTHTSIRIRFGLIMGDNGKRYV